MEKTIEILMRRDGNTRSEAKSKEVRDMLEGCNYDSEKSEEIFMSQLGLEMDYMEEFLFC